MRGETWSAKFYLKQNREESKEQTDLRVCPLQLWRWVRLLRESAVLELMGPGLCCSDLGVGFTSQ